MSLINVLALLLGAIVAVVSWALLWPWVGRYYERYLRWVERR